MADKTPPVPLLTAATVAVQHAETLALFGTATPSDLARALHLARLALDDVRLLVVRETGLRSTLLLAVRPYVRSSTPGSQDGRTLRHRLLGLLDDVERESAKADAVTLARAAEALDLMMRTARREEEASPSSPSPVLDFPKRS